MDGGGGPDLLHLRRPQQPPGPRRGCCHPSRGLVLYPGRNHPVKENPVWGEDWPAVRSLWPLDPGIAHLNHGSFGAVPEPVLAAQDDLRRATERNPTGFFWRTLPDLLEASRHRAANFLGADPEGLAFVPNATAGVNAVLASLDLRRGDELLLTDHAYGAVRITAERACARSHANLAVQLVPFSTWEEIVAAVLSGVTERTRLAILDHVASPTALVFPIRELVTELRIRGVPTLVDAAHAPGMLPVDLRTLDPDYWVGTFHKWCCAPRGSAALYARHDRRQALKPLVASFGAEDPFPGSFAWAGTDDYTPYLCVPAALDLLEELGPERVTEHNRALARLGCELLEAALGVPPVADGARFEAMGVVALPDGIARTKPECESLSARIAADLDAEVAITPWSDSAFVRLSAYAYNAPAEYERLAEGLPRLLRRF